MTSDMRPVIHLIIKYFDKKRMSGIFLLVILFLLLSGKVMINIGNSVQSAWYVITGDDNNKIAVVKNSYENNSMICLLKFRL